MSVQHGTEVPSTNTKDVVIGMYKAWDDGDMPKACSYWHDHVRIVAHGSREDTGIPFLGEFQSAKASYDALISCVDWTVFRCDDYLTVQEDANKLITRGSWGGTVLGKDAKPVSGAFFECRWVDVFCINNGKIASVESFFDTAAISKAFAASKQP